MDILNNIDTWIIGLKYNDKHKAILLQIKSLGSTVLFALMFKYWKICHRFGPPLLYGPTRYKWPCINSKKLPCVSSTKPHLIKNNYESTN